MLLGISRGGGFGESHSTVDGNTNTAFVPALEPCFYIALFQQIVMIFHSM